MGRAQLDIRNDSTRYKELVSVSTGVGASFMQFDLIASFKNGYWISPYLLYPYNLSAPDFVYQSIVYNGSIDWRIYKNSYIGIGATYQYLIDLPCVQIDPSQQTEKITRTNFGVSYFYNIPLSDALDASHALEMYGGGRIGISYWKDVLPQGMPSDDTYLATNRPNGVLVRGSIQVVLCMRCYPFYKRSRAKALLGGLGIHADIAFGTPYFAEGGITFAINTVQKR